MITLLYSQASIRVHYTPTGCDACKEFYGSDTKCKNAVAKLKLQTSSDSCKEVSAAEAKPCNNKATAVATYYRASKSGSNFDPVREFSVANKTMAAGQHRVCKHPYKCNTSSDSCVEFFVADAKCSNKAAKICNKACVAAATAPGPNAHQRKMISLDLEYSTSDGNPERYFYSTNSLLIL